jgi:hypothetical protein
MPIEKSSEAHLPADERRQVIRPDDLVFSGQVIHGGSWTAFDWIMWGAPYAAAGLVLGMLIDLAVRVLVC